MKIRERLFMSRDNSFELEWENTIQTLSEKTASYKEFEYFLDIWRKYSRLYDHRGNASKAVLVGHSFPEEIIRAMGIDYCYVLGGSFESSIAGNVNVPKDADDCMRSIVGILKSESLKLSKDDVVLVPLHNDGMKKLKGIIGELSTVICYEVPSDKDDIIQKKRFADEIERVTSELKKHFKKSLSVSKLRNQCELSKRACKSFMEFEKACIKSGLAHNSLFLFVVNSYNLCKDKEEWIAHVDLLTDEINGRTEADIDLDPYVLFFGSPIYAPDYKVMFVVEEMKLKILKLIHPDIEHIKIAGKIDTGVASVRSLSEAYLKADISPAFINNYTMTDLVAEALKDGRIKGIISHILRGEIEYDYELKSIEKLIADHNIPMNRIETVYNYQDIEQLRLRLEAFSEMLKKR